MCCERATLACYALYLLPAFGSPIMFLPSPYTLDQPLSKLGAWALPSVSIWTGSHWLTPYFLLSHDPPDTTPPYSPTPFPSCKFSSPGFNYPELRHIPFLQLLHDYATRTCLFRSAPWWPSLHVKVFSTPHFALDVGQSGPSSGAPPWYLFYTITFWGVGCFIHVKAYHDLNNNVDNDSNNDTS